MFIKYYVDPGQGFIFLQNTPFLGGIILFLLGAFLFLFKAFFRFFKRFFYFFLIILAILILGGIMLHKDNPVTKKVVLLGIDAFDPKIIDKLIKEGKLPNLKYLKEIGTYSVLDTVMPPESVVAWTSLITGLNPGGHGIFDFIMRDPGNYSLYLSLNEISANKNKPEIKIRRKGRAFWNSLTQNKIPSYIYFCPNTFPAEAIKGKMLSGMGVTDITGTMGRFLFYTTRQLSKDDQDSRGKVIQAKAEGNIIHTQIYGPKVAKGDTISESAIPLKIILFPVEGKVLIEFQGNHFFLNPGQWSQWQKASFNTGIFKRIEGITKFYLKSIKPEFELYVNPINFNPEDPSFDISYPKGYSKKVAEKVGLYHTQGMPHDTFALSEGRIDEKAFLEQVDDILAERKKILLSELKEFKRGLFFFYLDTLDAVQHMFWRFLDGKHPLYEHNSVYQDTIYEYYQKIDDFVGEALKRLDKDTTLVIVSDHGFANFRKSVHLNRWLLDNGYLALKAGSAESKGFFQDVDWAKTRAYSLGFGGIYLNKAGREYYGILSEEEAGKIKKEIKNKLKTFSDNQTQEMVVKDVYVQEEIFSGPYINEAPDLFVGFNDGYRASWQTAVGGIPQALIESNRKKWSGDHLLDRSLVPGVFFINKKIAEKKKSIIDIAPDTLRLLK